MQIYSNAGDFLFIESSDSFFFVLHGEVRFSRNGHACEQGPVAAAFEAGWEIYKMSRLCKQSNACVYVCARTRL